MRKSNKQEPTHTIEKDDWEKHDRRGKGGGKNCERDFSPSLFGRYFGASPISRCRKMFSSTTTELSIRRENASAKPPRTIVLTVPPPALMAMKAASADSGIDRKTAAVARMLPRNSRTMNPVSTRPIAPSCSRFSIATLHEHGLIEDDLGDKLLGNVDQIATAHL